MELTRELHRHHKLDHSFGGRQDRRRLDEQVTCPPRRVLLYRHICARRQSRLPCLGKSVMPSGAGGADGARQTEGTRNWGIDRLPGCGSPLRERARRRSSHARTPAETPPKPRTSSSSRCAPFVFGSRLRTARQGGDAVRAYFLAIDITTRHSSGNSLSVNRCKQTNQEERTGPMAR